jgi:hypothetical protein
MALCALLTGCATSSDMVQHGNLKVQFTQTQNQWAENVVLVTTCEKLQNGFCPPDAPTQVLVVSGKLPGVVSGVGQSMATLGAAALVRDGLVKSKSTVKQSNQTDIRASTVNPK